MSLVWCTDWRNSERLTKADRQRKCDIASVSPDWGDLGGGAHPFVFAKKHVIGTAPGYLSMGYSLGTAKSWNADLAARAQSEKWDIFPDGNRFATWESGTQVLYTLNLNAKGAAEGFAQMLVDRFPWANGYHFDYFTNLWWLAPTEQYAWSTAEFWNGWNDNLKLVVSEIRRLRPDWIIVGQNYHLTPATGDLDGLFLEMQPLQFGMTLAQHEQEKDTLSENGRAPVWVMEIRDPLRWGTRVASWTRWADKQGIYVSLGRDATAVGSS